MSFLDRLFGLLMPSRAKYRVTEIEATTTYKPLEKVETRVCKKTGVGVEIIARGKTAGYGYGNGANMVVFRNVTGGDTLIMCAKTFERLYLNHHAYVEYCAKKANPPGKLDERGWIATGVINESHRAARGYPRRQAVRWNKKEEMDLLDAHSQGLGVKKLARLHERSEGGVSSRLMDLGVLQ